VPETQNRSVAVGHEAHLDSRPPGRTGARVISSRCSRRPGRASGARPAMTSFGHSCAPLKSGET
jgi:hypothetical protein